MALIRALPEDYNLFFSSLSVKDDLDKAMAPVAKLELSALMRKGLVESGEMRTGVEVTLSFNLVNAVHLASPQHQLESFWVKLKSRQVCSEKSLMNCW